MIGGKKMEPEIKDLRKKIGKTKRGLEILYTLRFSILTILIFVVFITFIFRPNIINGNSMYPTLKDGEFAITGVVNRYISGIKRFDIVSVYSESEGKNLTKRVIGLPGETLQYRNDVLYIDGNSIDEYFLDEDYISEQTKDNTIDFTEDFGPIKLKGDEYFLCGDNRRISKDSRVLGPFKEEDILTKGMFILF